MLYIKALHIIFIVTWFAGLFYIVRLFVYFAETQEKSSPEREILQKYLKDWQKRLWYGITFPSAILTAILGFSMLYWYPLNNWLTIKIGFVIGLFVYHFSCHIIFLQQQKGIIKYTGYQLRIWNEVATIFLVAIVFLVVLKNFLSLIWGLFGLLLLMAVLFTAINIYKNIRKKGNQ
ncbi:MAG: CopD family protein [Microscillaceae bacterium]|nr:CopD family protein [Microscillaceae bacterium]MDW8461652.1 CopD family protein [Cytophagales bacterium]